ncbi:hypothetical protein HFO32_17530 [Rhizobium leguminosarum]|uniref:hypothetical protein n=1 Tax=Rhizobium TaxID=379 RepID=UPI001C90C5B4|nr:MULTISPECIES: hypothetical protein [Rhizobium]MBY3050884.1 hypothetical protein [Rhizobium laguerreae]MBY5671317.1 hypothetical protein [Rhizobium leguminosarum]MBY5683935.1 hypothetical protein [Rhizobium leguminosarum]
MRDDFIENPPVDPSMIGEAKTRMSYAAIRLKEMRGDEAKDVSEEKVLAIEYLFIEQHRRRERLTAAA